MAKQDLGKIVPTFNGIYNANIVYEKLCIVNYNGSVYVSKKDIPKGTDISNEEYWYLLIEKLKKGIDYFTEEDRQAIIDEVTKLAESDFNKYYDEKKKALDKVASDNTTAFLKVVKDNTTDFNSNVDTQTKAFDTHYDEKFKSFDENSDEQTTAYNTNANKKLNDYNENHASKMQELDDEAAKKIAEYDEHSEELRNMAISTDNKVERLKNEVLDTGTESDTFIHIEDSCMAKLKDLEVEGVCQQETTSGKNSFNKIDYSTLNLSTNGNPTNLVKENNTIKFTTSSNDYCGFYLNNADVSEYIDDYDTNKTYYLSLDISSTANVNFRIGAVNTKIESISSTKKRIFVATKISSVITFYRIGTIEGTTITIENLMISENEDTDFEKYTGCQASPSPSYPQAIKTITNTLKIMSCNSQFFNANCNSTRYGIQSVIQKNKIILNGTNDYPGSILGNSQTSSDYAIKLGNIPKGDYKLSLKIAGGSVDSSVGGGSALYIRDCNDATLATGINILRDGSINFYNDRYTEAYIQIYVNQSGWIFNDYTMELMLTPNNTTVYQEKFESLIEIILPENEFVGKLNDTYKDVLRVEYDQEDGKYHLKLDKKIGRKVFNADDNWTRSNNNASFRFSIGNADYVKDGNYEIDIPKFKSNYFHANNFANIYLKDQLGISWWFNDTKTNWVLSFGNDMSLEDFKTFLSEHIVEVYYPLSTPYELDLGSISMPLSYKEITNIFTNSDLLPKITAEYYRTFEKTIQNMQINEKSLKQEITDLNNNLSDITKRLEALESANASIVEESEVPNDLQN